MKTQRLLMLKVKFWFILLMFVSLGLSSCENTDQGMPYGDDGLGGDGEDAPVGAVCGIAYVCGEVLVGIENEAGKECENVDEALIESIFEEIAQDNDLDIQEIYTCLQTATFLVPDNKEAEWVEILSADERVSFVETHLQTMID